MTRTCRECGEEITRNHFLCNECQKNGILKRKEERKHKYVNQVKKGKELEEKLKEFITIEIKPYSAKIKRINQEKNIGCYLCGFNDSPEACKYIHRAKEEKEFTINKMSIGQKGTRTILEEMKKCHVICLNCIAKHKIKS